MSAAGKVGTGLSLPYVASYSASGTTVTYSGGTKLGRAVEVSVEAEAANDNVFYADNQPAESANVFAGGTLSITIDGPLDTTEKLIMGLPAAESLTVDGDTVDIYHFNDSQAIPYVGVGFVLRHISDGTTTYKAVILPKVKFDPDAISASTAEDTIEFQTQELTASIFRSDNAAGDWKLISEDLTSEADAEAVIKTYFSIT